MARRSPPPPSTFETHDSVEPLRAEWEALAERTAASPFVRPGWVEAWYAAFGRGRPLVATLRRDGSLTAIAALEFQGGTLRSATNWHTPLYDVVAESRDDSRELARRLVALGPRRLELRFLERNGLAFDAFGAAVSEAGYRMLTRPLLESPYVELGGGWERYAASLSGSMLKQLARKRRTLEREQGPVSLRVETELGEGAETLELGLRLEASGWKRREGTAIVSRPETRAFYEQVARWAADQGWLRLSFLWSGERAAAFQLDLEAGGILYHLKPGYDEELARFSPGRLLTEDVLRDAFARNLAGYEFLGAAARHKLEWTRRVREQLLLQAFAPTPAGLAELAAFRLGRPAAARALGASRRAVGALRR